MSQTLKLEHDMRVTRHDLFDHFNKWVSNKPDDPFKPKCNMFKSFDLIWHDSFDMFQPIYISGSTHLLLEAKSNQIKHIQTRQQSHNFIFHVSWDCILILRHKFLQTGLEEITSNPYKIVTSVYKHLKGTLIHNLINNSLLIQIKFNVSFKYL